MAYFRARCSRCGKPMQLDLFDLLPDRHGPDRMDCLACSHTSPVRKRLILSGLAPAVLGMYLANRFVAPFSAAWANTLLTFAIGAVVYSAFVVLCVKPSGQWRFRS